MKGKSQKIAFLGLCTALALILAYVEIMIQPLIPSVPGIKMGLPNIIIIFLLYRRGAGAAISVSLVRIILVSMLFSNVVALSYSLAGAILSLVVMLLLRKLNFMSAVGVSVAGGVAHNIGQILMAMFLLETVELGYYLVILTVTGTAAGVLVGLCGSLLIKKIPQKKVF